MSTPTRRKKQKPQPDSPATPGSTKTNNSDTVSVSESSLSSSARRFGGVRRMFSKRDKNKKTPTSKNTTAAAVASTSASISTATDKVTTKDANKKDPPPPQEAAPGVQSVTAALAFETTPSAVTAETKSSASPKPKSETETNKQENGEEPAGKKPDKEDGAATTTPGNATNKAPPKHSNSGNLSRSLKEKLAKARSASWLTNTKTFQRMCNKAFELVDTDESGTVDEKELYSGLLLIHLKLGMYAGPAACRPLGRERCHKVFAHFDDDQDGLLGHKEFEGVMMVLFSNVLFRVLVQWSMTIIIVPIVANHILELFYRTVEFVYWCIVNADEYFSLANSIELTIEAVVAYVWERTPEPMVVVLDSFVECWQAVPDSVWNAAPLALISTILGILVVPWIIIKVDDFFQYLAERADTDGSGFDEEDEDQSRTSRSSEVKSEGGSVAVSNEPEAKKNV